MADIPIRCDCGEFRGVLHRAGPRHGSRVVCYCKSCQAFAHFLGRSEDVLDKNGGTDVYQASPGRLEIRQGQELLACVHLTKAPTLRWYTDCCRSPIGNTLNTNRLPFIGLIHSCIDTTEPSGGLDALIGPVRARLNGESASGDTSGLEIEHGTPLALYWRFGMLVLMTKLRGEHRKSPLFNRETGQPVVNPTRL